MYKQKTMFFACLFLLFTAQQNMAENSGIGSESEWELARSENDVSIYYRWITTDSMKTREMRAQLSIHAGTEKILAQFNNADNYHLWAAGIKECSIREISDSSWLTYTLMNYPWPFKQKDLVTFHRVFRKENTTILSILAEPQSFAEKPGVERMQNYTGEWWFVASENGDTAVEYRVISFTKPVFPRFIQDPVIQKIFIDSLNDLKKLAETK